MNSFAPLLWLALSGVVAFFAYWGVMRVRGLLWQYWSQGSLSRLSVVGWLVGFFIFTFAFFTVFDVKNGALWGYLVIVALALMGFEVYSSRKESVLAAQEERIRREQKRAQLATGEGWAKGDVLEKFRTTVFYRKYGQVKATFGWRCAVCGKNLYQRADASLDHIKPQSKYPELRFSEANLQVLCRPCNSTKSAYDDDDWKTVTRKRRRVITRKSKTLQNGTRKNQ